MSRLLAPCFAASPLAAPGVLGQKLAIIAPASELIIGSGAAAS